MSFECKNCPDRHLGCHSACESYLQEKSKIEERNQKRYKEKLTEIALREYWHDVRKRRKIK